MIIFPSQKLFTWAYVNNAFFFENSLITVVRIFHQLSHTASRSARTITQGDWLAATATKLAFPWKPASVTLNRHYPHLRVSELLFNTSQITQNAIKQKKLCLNTALGQKQRSCLYFFHPIQKIQFSLNCKRWNKTDSSCVRHDLF